MNLKKTVFFAIILSAVIIYTAKYEIPGEAAAAKKELLISDLKQDDISTISIKSSYGENKFSKNKDSKKWFLDGVVNAPLDESKVSTILDSVETLKKGYAIPKEDTEADKTPYGLKDPSLTLGLNDKILLFGKKNEYLGKRYIEKQGDETIYLADDNFFDNINKPVKDFRDNQPLKFLDSEVKEIKFKNSETGEVTIKKTGTPIGIFPWKLVTNKGEFTASKENTEKLLRDLRNAKADNFIDSVQDRKEYGLDTPILNINLIREGADKISVNYSRINKVENSTPKDKNYIVVSGYPSVFSLSAGDIDTYPGKSISDLREKKLFQFDTDKIKSIKFEGERFPENLEIKKDGTVYKIDDKAADDNFVKTFIKAVSEVEAKSFTENKFDTAKPCSKIILDNGKILYISNTAENDGIHTFVEGSSEPFFISSDSLKKIAPKKEALIKPETLPTAVPTEVAE